MREIFVDVRNMSREDISKNIRRSEKYKSQINGDGKTLTKEFNEWFTKLKAEAVKVCVCPACGDNLLWNYRANQIEKEVTGYLKCKNCDYEVAVE